MTNLPSVDHFVIVEQTELLSVIFGCWSNYLRGVGWGRPLYTEVVTGGGGELCTKRGISGGYFGGRGGGGGLIMKVVVLLLFLSFLFPNLMIRLEIISFYFDNRKM